MAGDVSVMRFKGRSLEREVRDPVFQRMVDAGYRPIIVLPFEEREGDPEVLVVLAPPVLASPTGWRAAEIVQVAALVVLVVLQSLVLVW